jgi:hypothetical protein
MSERQGLKRDIEAFLTDYLGEMVEGNAAVFAGAGLSIPAGFVDWRELVRPLLKEIDLDADLETDFVAAAQFHVNANGANRHRLHQAVIDALSKKAAPTENHRLLASLPISIWWTTNYDKLIEDALRAAGKTVDIKSAVPQMATTRPGRDATVFKMHGDIDRPEEAVATKDDFERYERDRGAFTSALAGDLVSKTFLFLGFSFTDPNLEQVLSRVRLTFNANQRRHFAIFRNRTKLHGESDEQFHHFRARQGLIVEDLKRFNVKVLLVDDYSEITDILRELVNRYRRRTIFISGSAEDFGPWGEEEVAAFAQTIGQALVSRGTRIATGLGRGIGDAVFTGALRELMRSGARIDDSLILRPFPQGASSAEEQARMWDEYRREILSHAGIAIFMFGNKISGQKTDVAEGVLREFDIAVEKGLIVLPIGATGSASALLAAKSLQEPERFLFCLDQGAQDELRALSTEGNKLNALIEPLLHLIQKLQKVT